jgi:hypothetical protein
MMPLSIGTYEQKRQIDVLHPNHAVYRFALVLGVPYIGEFCLILEEGVIAHW